MKFVLQRVLEASVCVDGKIGKGFLLLTGISDDDNKEVNDKMTEADMKVSMVGDCPFTLVLDSDKIL